MTELEKQFDWYLAHQDELVKQFNGKWIVVHGDEVGGNFDTELDAYNFAIEHFTPGEFIIQLVTPGSESYTQTFHSRVEISPFA
jgi:hypothetical protein